MEAVAAMQKKHREWGPLHLEIRNVGGIAGLPPRLTPYREDVPYGPLAPPLRASWAAEAAVVRADWAAEDLLLHLDDGDALAAAGYPDNGSAEPESFLKRRRAARAGYSPRAESPPRPPRAQSSPLAESSSRTVIPPTMYNWHGMPLRCETRLQLGLEQDEQPQPERSPRAEWWTSSRRMRELERAEQQMSEVPWPRNEDGEPISAEDYLMGRGATASGQVAAEWSMREEHTEHVNQMNDRQSAAADDLELTTNSEGEHVPRLDRDRRDQRTRMLEATSRLHRRIERAIERSESSSHDAN